MRLAAINTIGLTGAEILAAEMARFPEMLMLPGQNFITYGTHCYRPHRYDGWAAEDVFANLYKHQFTRSGHCWAGLTKSMSEALLARYSREAHLEAFRKLTRDDATTLEHFKNYSAAYCEITGGDVSQKKFTGFFGHNIVLNAEHYPDFENDSVVLNFSNPLDYWLANIGQRMVWENLSAIKFWIVNTLYVKAWEIAHPGSFATFDIREYADDPEAVSSRIARFLDLSRPAGEIPDGFIRYSQGLVGKIERDAKVLGTVYEGWADYEMGVRLDEWAADFVTDPEIAGLLKKYEAFWNSTSHTNLDWVGPIEEEIIEKAREFSGAANRRNLSRWFYHECFSVHSDNWQKTEGRLEHYLGNLEDEIPLPEMPYYARVAVCYLNSVAENTIKRAYSALPIRGTSFYKRLAAPEYRKNFARWAMEESFAELEKKIDEADAAIAKFS